MKYEKRVKKKREMNKSNFCNGLNDKLFIFLLSPSYQIHKKRYLQMLLELWMNSIVSDLTQNELNEWKISLLMMVSAFKSFFMSLKKFIFQVFARHILLSSSSLHKKMKFVWMNEKENRIKNEKNAIR